MNTFITSLIASFAGVLLGLGLFRLIARWKLWKLERSLSNGQFSNGPPPPKVPEQPDGESGSADLYKIAELLQTHFDQSAHPKDLLARPEFERGVELLMVKSYSTSDLLNYAAGTNTVICCLAFEALARRTVEQDIFEPTMSMLGGLGY